MNIIQKDPRFDRKRQLAMAMMSKSLNRQPVQSGNAHWSQGLAQVLNGFVGGRMMRTANDEEQSYNKEGFDTMARALNPDFAQVGEQAGPTQTPKVSRQDYATNTLMSHPSTRAYGAQLKMNGLFNPQKREVLKDANGRQRYQDSGEQVFPDVDVKQPGFEGTGIEAQSLNILLDESISNDDPRKILAKQRLQRKTTTVTPEGTYVQDGYDLNFLNPEGDDPLPTSNEPPSFVPKESTDAERISSGFYDRMVNAQENIDRLGDYDPSTLPEVISGKFNATASKEFQQYKQAADDWIRAKLRKESGAVINPEEMEQEFETYFPRFGDSPEVIEQKTRARKIAEEAMKNNADLVETQERSGQPPAFASEQDMVNYYKGLANE